MLTAFQRDEARRRSPAEAFPSFCPARGHRPLLLRSGPRSYAIAVDGVVVGAILHRKTKRRKTKRRSQTGWRFVLPSGSRRFKTLKTAKEAAEAMLGGP